MSPGPLAGSALELVPGEHLQLGTPQGPAWPQVVAKIEKLLS